MQTSKKNFLLTSVVFILSITGCAPDKDKNTANVTTTHSVAATPASPSFSPNQHLPPASAAPNIATTQCNNQAINTAYQAQNPNQKIQVLGCGQIVKLLKDDTDGSQHQKFLVKIDGYPQITVLIAHNIDLAHRINTLQPNQPIRFYGEYIYNPKGGVVHWTHKDPAARHQDGWLEYQGQKYQ